MIQHDVIASRLNTITCSNEDYNVTSIDILFVDYLLFTI